MGARSAVEPRACAVCGAHLAEEARSSTCGRSCSRLVMDLEIFATEDRLPLAPRMRLLLAGLLEGVGSSLRLTDRGREVARALGIVVSTDEEAAK